MSIAIEKVSTRRFASCDECRALEIAELMFADRYEVTLGRTEWKHTLCALHARELAAKVTETVPSDRPHVLVDSRFLAELKELLAAERAERVAIAKGRDALQTALTRQGKERDLYLKCLDDIATVLGDQGEWSFQHERSAEVLEMVRAVAAERDELERELASARVRAGHAEKDRIIMQAQLDGSISGHSRTLQERDEARAEVERIKLAIAEEVCATPFPISVSSLGEEMLAEMEREERDQEESPPVCTTCNDTHQMPLGEDDDRRMVMCTRCPKPCQRCRAGGNGPYCERTPCSCVCHAQPQEPARG